MISFQSKEGTYVHVHVPVLLELLQTIMLLQFAGILHSTLGYPYSVQS